jgi:hypothetical protein
MSAQRYVEVRALAGFLLSKDDKSYYELVELLEKKYGRHITMTMRKDALHEWEKLKEFKK